MTLRVVKAKSSQTEDRNYYGNQAITLLAKILLTYDDSEITHDGSSRKWILVDVFTDPVKHCKASNPMLRTIFDGV